MINSRRGPYFQDEKGSETGFGTLGDRGMNKSRVEVLAEKLRDKQIKPSQYRVLVVDDMAAMRDLIVTMLSRQGHQCIRACDGLEALGKAKEEKIDAVVTDIVMPEMDGIALTKELSSKRHGLPVMVLTGHSKEFSEEAALASGAREFIRKPFSVDEFMLRFHKMMREHEALLQTEAKRNQMIFNIQQECDEKVREAEKGAEKIREKLYSSYVAWNDY
jgi:DNA-binding response OmpR family regulator